MWGILAAAGDSGASIGVDQLVAFVLGATAAGVSALGLMDRRRQQVSDTWKALAEAKAAEATDCDERLSALEERVELLQSGWMTSLASHVAAAVVEAVVEVQRDHRT